MKTTSSHRCLALGAGASLLLASVASAQLAYEGFAYTEADLGGFVITIPADATALQSISASGYGFDGSWTITSGGGGASTFSTAGLEYPATYPGTNVATGGNARALGTTSDRSYMRLNLEESVATTLNDSVEIYVGFLAERQGDTMIDYINADPGDSHDEAWRNQWNLASEYPANFGVRLMNSATPNNNSALGTLGKAGDWNSNGVNIGDPNPLIIDTWGLGGWKDTHKVYSGADFANGVDHIVGRLNTETNQVTFWINPQLDGSAEGMLDFVYADGDDLPEIAVYAFGFEAGRDQEWAVADFVFDEIYFGTDFSSVAGFEMVPEPSMIGFLGFGLIASLLGLRRRR